MTVVLHQLCFIKICVAGGGGSSSPKVQLQQQQPSQQQHHQQQQHFRHFNHKENTSGKQYSLFSPPHAQRVISEATPRRGATIYTRPRSASIGNRLSDAEQPEDPETDDHHHNHHAHYHHHYRHRRHHTLDGHQHQVHGGHYEDEERQMISFGNMATTSSRSISSKSEKSSSRSSQSPSVENIRHGESY